MLKAAIMQPYFWPYLGYFQLLHAADRFVIYDNIEYTKRGWINRNRFLCNGQDKYFTVPIAKDSDYLEVRERRVSSGFERCKVLNQIEAAYRKAPYFKDIFPIFCQCMENKEENLFGFIRYSVGQIVDYLDIDTEIIVSSTLGIGREVQGKDKVLAICRQLNADVYINPIGGRNLYDKQEFEEHGINLLFLRMDPIRYQQFGVSFVESLSILDVMMFNSKEQVKKMLDCYTLL